MERRIRKIKIVEHGCHGKYLGIGIERGLNNLKGKYYMGGDRSNMTILKQIQEQPLPAEEFEVLLKA
ncbi:MAG: hypothetical protein CSA29_03225 [Desulfobacterales bacterium]|nr:MAG: hypothetical protein CSA29_03225 [Desulfobacterales bacterium]